MPPAEDDATPEVHADRYEKLELLGRGSFGDVYRGWDRGAGMEVAIKVIDLEDVEDDIDDIHKEVAVLAQCKNSNITEYYASVLQPGSTELLIVMELMSSSVADLLDDGASLDERSIAFVLREVLKALVYLHSENRIHRDVKAANVLLSAHGEVKISDFGVSGQMTNTVGFRRRTFVGTPFWMAPEVIESRNNDGYTETADIWSLGITAIEMALGKPPHSDLHPMRVLFLIPQEAPPVLEGPFSKEFKDFVALCLNKEPTKRPSAASLLKHAFVLGPHDSGRLAEMVLTHSEQRREVQSRGGMYGALETDAQTLPKWEFNGQGTRTVRGGTSANRRGTLRSHQINSFTIRDSTWGSTFARSRFQTAANGGGGTLRAVLPEGEEQEDDYGDVVASPQRLNSNHIFPSRDFDDRPAEALPEHSARAEPSGNGFLIDPEVDDKRMPSEDAAAHSSAAEEEPGVSGHGMADASTFQDTAGSVQPAGSDTANGQHPSLRELDSASISRVQSPLMRRDSHEVLTSILQPALTSAVGDGGQGGSAAAFSAVNALAAVEGQVPGALSTALSEVLRLLSSSSQQSSALSPIKAQAEGLFGTRRRSSDSARQLGPLGTFLLSRWRESVSDIGQQEEL